MSSEAPKSEQIQANVAAALSRLRGDLSASSVASAVISVGGPGANTEASTAPELVSADPLQTGMPEMPNYAADATLQADPAMANPSISERRMREPGSDKATPMQRIAGLQIDQPDLLSDVANTPPPLGDLPDPEASGAMYARRRRNRAMLLGGVAAVIVLGAAWALMRGGGDEVSAPPVITADATPEKVKPEDEGGMQVPNLNTTILDQTQEQQGETVMPAPETPVAPPTPAPAVTDTVTPETPAVADANAIPAPAAPDVPSVTAPDTTATPVTPEPAATTAAEPAPAPTPDPAPAAAAPTPEPTPAPDPATVQTAAAPVSVPADSIRIQVAAVKSEAVAQEEWSKLQKRYPAILGGLGLNVEKVDKGGSVLYRVQAGPFADKAAAKRACVELKAQNQDCIVAR